MRREYPERPWTGVGVVVWQGDRVLLVRRGRPPRQGQWGLPGGAQEVGETVFEAAAREVREETGLEVRPVAIITTVDSITRDADGAVQYHYTLVEVAADCAAGDPVAADDAADARWATLEEAEGLVEWDETRRILGLSAAQRPRILAEPPPAR
jgi:8-oxo-dGTP diphosphatase